MALWKEQMSHVAISVIAGRPSGCRDFNIPIRQAPLAENRHHSALTNAPPALTRKTVFPRASDLLGPMTELFRVKALQIRDNRIICNAKMGRRKGDGKRTFDDSFRFLSRFHSPPLTKSPPPTFASIIAPQLTLEIARPSRPTPCPSVWPIFALEAETMPVQSSPLDHVSHFRYTSCTLVTRTAMMISFRIIRCPFSYRSTIARPRALLISRYYARTAPPRCRDLSRDPAPPTRHSMRTPARPDCDPRYPRPHASPPRCSAAHNLQASLLSLSALVICAAIAPT
ncbi:hypothetical protein FB451DRAFT_1189707 [Mycena latifolia]|nr:hypothetical protein FB451DRAFT_1189707 [Mycena latifolia]